MKIKITEGQATRLKLINEDVNMVAKFEEFCNAKIQEINNLFVSVSNISVIEIIGNEIGLSKIYKRLNIIENKVMLAERETYASIDEASEENLDLRIDRAYDSVTAKLSSLQLIVMELEKLQELSNEHNLKKSFDDIKPIDVTPTES